MNASDIDAIVAQLTQAAKRIQAAPSTSAEVASIPFKNRTNPLNEQWLEVMSALDHDFYGCVSNFKAWLKKQDGDTTPPEHMSEVLKLVSRFEHLKIMYTHRLSQLQQIYIATRNAHAISFDTFKNYNTLFESHYRGAKNIIQSMNELIEMLKGMITTLNQQKKIPPKSKREKEESEEEEEEEKEQEKEEDQKKQEEEKHKKNNKEQVKSIPKPPVVIPPPVEKQYLMAFPFEALFFTTGGKQPNEISNVYQLVDHLYDTFLPYTYYGLDFSNDPNIVRPKNELLGVTFLPIPPKDKNLLRGNIYQNIDQLPSVIKAFEMIRENITNFIALEKVETTGWLNALKTSTAFFSGTSPEPKNQLRDNQALQLHLKLNNMLKTNQPLVRIGASEPYLEPYLASHIFSMFYDRITGFWEESKLNIIFSMYESLNDPSALNDSDRWHNKKDFFAIDPNDTTVKAKIDQILQNRYNVSIFNYFFLLSRLSHLVTPENQDIQQMLPLFKWLKNTQFINPTNTGVYDEINEYQLYDGKILQPSEIVPIHESFVNTGGKATSGPKENPYEEKTIRNWFYYNTSFFYTMPFFGEFNNLLSRKAGSLWRAVSEEEKQHRYMISLNWLGVVFGQTPTETRNTKKQFITVGENTQFYRHPNIVHNQHLCTYIQFFNVFDIPILPKKEGLFFFDWEAESQKYAGRFSVYVGKFKNPVYQEKDPLTQPGESCLLPIPRLQKYSINNPPGQESFKNLMYGFNYSKNGKTPAAFYEAIFQIQNCALKTIILEHKIKEPQELARFWMNQRFTNQPMYKFNDISSPGTRFKYEYIKRTIVTYVVPFLQLINVFINLPNYDTTGAFKKTFDNWCHYFNQLPECTILGIKLDFNVYHQDGEQLFVTVELTKPESKEMLTSPEALHLFSLALWMSIQGEVLLFNKSLVPQDSNLKFEHIHDIFEFGVTLMKERILYKDKEVISLPIQSHIPEHVELTVDEVDEWFNWGKSTSEQDTIHTLPPFSDDED